MENRSSKTGKYGEAIAENYLKSKGYKIITKNYHTRYGEIDIIATLPQHIEFVEVKTRFTSSMTAPEESVDRRKIMKIVKSAQIFIQNNPQTKSWRISLVGILLNSDKSVKEIIHIWI